MAYVSIEQLLCGPSGWFAQDLSIAARTKTPDDLTPSLPIIQVRPVGGAEIAPGIDEVLLDIDCFAGPSESDVSITADVAAQQLAEDVRESVTFRLYNYAASGANVSMTKTTQRPVPRDWDNDQDIARYQASYRIRLHTLRPDSIS